MDSKTLKEFIELHKAIDKKNLEIASLKREIASLKREIEALKKENERIKKDYEKRIEEVKHENDLELMYLRKALEEEIKKCEIYRGQFAVFYTTSEIFKTLADCKSIDDVRPSLDILKNALCADAAILFKIVGEKVEIEEISSYTGSEVFFEQKKFINDKDEFNIGEKFKTYIDEVISKENTAVINNQDGTYPLLSKYNINRVESILVSVDNDETYAISIFNPGPNKKCNLLLIPAAGAYRSALTILRKMNIIKDMAEKDGLTNLYNRSMFDAVCKQINRTPPESLCMIMIDLFRLKYANDNFGHEAGDLYISTVANILKKFFSKDYTFRIGGDEFYVIIENESYEYCLTKIIAAQAELEDLELRDSNGNEIISRFDYGLEYRTENIVCEEMMRIADKQMEENKRSYYLQNGIERRK